MKRRASLPIAATLAAALLAMPGSARPAADDAAKRDVADLALFERKAALSKELGATHIVITEGLPLATWEMDEADPYPAWYVHHASLLKIFPPKDVAALREHGLRGEGRRRSWRSAAPSCENTASRPCGTRTSRR